MAKKLVFTTNNPSASTDYAAADGTWKTIPGGGGGGSGTVTSVATTAPITGGTITTSGTIGITQASGSTDGYLSSANWNTFNSKQDNITGAATTVTTANLTANRAVISNGSGKIAVSSVTDTEVGYLSGVTSSIQTQLNTKISTSNQILTFQVATTIGASTTTFLNVGITATAIETAATMVMPVACNLSNMYTIHYTTTQPASGAQHIVVRKNGVDTAISITIAAGSAPSGTPYSDITNSVSFAVGDRLSFKRQNVASGVGGAISGLSIRMTI